MCPLKSSGISRQFCLLSHSQPDAYRRLRVVFTLFSEVRRLGDKDSTLWISLALCYWILTQLRHLMSLVGSTERRSLISVPSPYTCDDTIPTRELLVMDILVCARIHEVTDRLPIVRTCIKLCQIFTPIGHSWRETAT